MAAMEQSALDAPMRLVRQDARWLPLQLIHQGELMRAMQAALADTWQRDAWMVHHRSGRPGPPPGGLLLATLRHALRDALLGPPGDRGGSRPRKT